MSVLEDPTFSRAQRDDYSGFLVGLMQRFENDVENLVESVLSEPEPSYFSKKVYPSSYNTAKLERSLQTKIGPGDRVVILKTIQYQMEKGAQMALNQIQHPSRQVRGITGQFINEGTLRELYSINIRHIESIQQDHIKNIELLIARFIGGGTVSWHQLKKGIKLIGQVSDTKAAQIARTEVIRAISTSQSQTLIATGQKLWRWITARDERVCKVCGPLEGKVVRIGTPFAYYRGQPILNSPVHPNCRCGQKAV